MFFKLSSFQYFVALPFYQTYSWIHSVFDFQLITLHHGSQKTCVCVCVFCFLRCLLLLHLSFVWNYSYCTVMPPKPLLAIGWTANVTCRYKYWIISKVCVCEFPFSRQSAFPMFSEKIPPPPIFPTKIFVIAYYATIF